MSLLDFGCGEGTITVDLAAAVAPGEVMGIDIGPSQIELATAHAAERQLSNVRFEVGSVYELPFEDESFDAAFAHTVLQHLKEPTKALREVHRVLKHHGVVGIRDMDRGGILVAPPDSSLVLVEELWSRLREHNGSDPNFGRRQRAVLREAGFVDINVSATYDIEDPRIWGERLANLIEESSFVSQVVELGWATDEQIKEMKAALVAWGKHPDAFLAHSRCEAVASKA